MTAKKKSMPKDARRNSFQVTLDDDEKALLEKAAGSTGLPTAGFIRSEAIKSAKRLLKQET